MKKVLGILLTVVLIASFASAELLVTANPLGQGKWAVLGAGMQDSSIGGSGSTVSMTTFGGYAGYGLTNKLDALINLGSASFSLGNTTVTSYGLILKYALMEEENDLPVSVALGGGYRTMNYSTSQTGNQISVGIGASKMMIPFVPYGGLTYRSTSFAGAALSTQIDLTVGSALAWSQHGAVFAEYTMQSITPNGAANYTGGQMALGIGYSI